MRSHFKLNEFSDSFLYRQEKEVGVRQRVCNANSDVFRELL